MYYANTNNYRARRPRFEAEPCPDGQTVWTYRPNNRENPEGSLYGPYVVLKHGRYFARADSRDHAEDICLIYARKNLQR